MTLSIDKDLFALERVSFKLTFKNSFKRFQKGKAYFIKLVYLMKPDYYHPNDSPRFETVAMPKRRVADLGREELRQAWVVVDPDDAKNDFITAMLAATGGHGFDTSEDAYRYLEKYLLK